MTWLKGVLAEFDVSARGFAKDVGVNERTVRRWVANEGSIPPTVRVLIQVARVAMRSGRSWSDLLHQSEKNG